MSTPQDYSLPYPSWRLGQEEALQELLEKQKENKYLFLEAPTSFGKSLVAMGMANSTLDNDHEDTPSSSLVLTKTKMLATQYLRDFQDVQEIRGRNNYPCYVYPNMSAGDPKTPCMAGKSRIFGLQGSDCRYNCPYIIAKTTAAMSQKVVTNYDYFLADANLGAGSLVPRGLGIADEAHSIEDTLLDFCTLNLSPSEFEDMGLEYPELGSDALSLWRDWARGLELQLKLMIQAQSKSTNYNYAWEDVGRLQHLLGNLQRFTHAKEGSWFAESWKDGIRLSPVWATDYFDNYMGGHFQHMLLMSATLISTHDVARWLGIQDYSLVKAGSNIRVEDRPLFYCPVARVSGKKAGYAATDLVEWVDKLIEAYYPLPALIHTVNYNLRNVVVTNSKFRRDMLTHDMSNREQVCKQYMDKRGFTVLVSPSLGLGADFPDKQALQIILKYPFLSLGDRRVGLRKTQDSRWYPWSTVAGLAQQYGRGSRVPGHISDTWLFDSIHDWYYHQYRNLYPSWFTQALTKVAPEKLTEVAMLRGNYIRYRRSGR